MGFLINAAKLLRLKRRALPENLLLVSLLNRTVYVVRFQTSQWVLLKVCCSEYLQRVG